MMQFKQAFTAVLAMLFVLTARAVSVSQFGAIGDGVTDDSASIEKALNSDANIEFENKTYLLKQQINIIRKHNKTIDFRKAIFVRADTELYGIRFAGAGKHVRIADIEVSSSVCVAGGDFQPLVSNGYGIYAG